MKNYKKAALLCLFSLCFVHFCRAEVVLDTSFISQIKNIMAKPMKIYKLDIDARINTFNKIDDWFGDHIDYSKSVQFEDKVTGRVIYRIGMRENIPIVIPGQLKKGVEPTQEFFVFYIVNKKMRSFIKQVHIPSETTLPDSTVIELGNVFLLRSKFYDLAENEKIFNPEVMSQKRESWDEKDGGVQLMFQRVLFHREYMGAEVLNSRQIVRFHPESRELLSYKTVDWTPVNESSGEEAAYKKIDDVVMEILEIGDDSKLKYYVTKIKHGFYETETQLVPAIQVFIQPESNSETAIAEMHRLTISLVPGIELIKKPEVDLKLERIK
jgi:hypothetical protein